MSVAAVETRVRVDRWFYIGVGFLLILLNVLGFAPSLVDPSSRMVPLPLTPLVAAHALTGSAFILVFVAQATLVAAGRTDMHRRFGMAGAVLALAFVVLGFLSMVEEARRGFDLSGDLASLPPAPGAGVTGDIMLPSIFFLTFAILFGAAMIFRRHPEVHRRLMLFAILGGLFSTPVAHISGHWPALQPWANLIFPITSAMYLSIPAVHDRVVTGRIHPVSLWVAITVFLSQTAFNVLIVPSNAWDSFATWLIH